MPHDEEWYGEPHTITVHEVHLPHGPGDDGCLDYDLEHPPSCQQETHGEGENSYLEWTCDVAHDEGDCGLASSLRYSGTPITEPGTYRIQAWGRMTYYPGAGCEVACGVGVMEPEATA